MPELENLSRLAQCYRNHPPPRLSRSRLHHSSLLFINTLYPLSCYLSTLINLVLYQI